MRVKFILILLVIFVVLLVLNHYDFTWEQFINYLPITKTIKCFNDNKNMLSFLTDMNNIFDKYEIKSGEFEISTKFTEDDINPNRLVAFIPYKYIKKDPSLLEKCYDVNRIPSEVQEVLGGQINALDFTRAQLLFGIDLGEESRRVYFNYVIKNHIHLIGYNIEEKSIAKKIYNEMKRGQFKKELRELIGSRRFEALLDLFPESIWKIIGTKEDENVKEYKHASYYINMSFEYRLSQFEDKVVNFLKMFYGGKNDLLEKWYNCFKHNSVTWLSIGRGRDGKLFITVYLVHNRNIRDFVDIKKLKQLNKEIEELKKL